MDASLRKTMPLAAGKNPPKHLGVRTRGKPKFSELPASLRTQSDWSGALLVAISES